MASRRCTMKSGATMRGSLLVILVLAVTSVAALCHNPSAPGGLAGILYNLTLGSAGDGIFTNYTFQGGLLPPGLSFTGGLGGIAGTPTQTGTYAFALSRCSSTFDRPWSCSARARTHRCRTG